MDLSANTSLAIKSNVLQMKMCDCAKQINDKTSIPADSQIEVTHNTILTQFPTINSAQSLINVRQNNNNQSNYNSPTDHRIFQMNDSNIRINENLRKSSSVESTDRFNRQRRNRHNFDSRQTAILETLFEQSTHYPDSLTIDHLSKQIRMPINKIQIWFQNRRAKFRRSSAASLKNRF